MSSPPNRFIKQMRQFLVCLTGVKVESGHLNSDFLRLLGMNVDRFMTALEYNDNLKIFLRQLRTHWECFQRRCSVTSPAIDVIWWM